MTRTTRVALVAALAATGLLLTGCTPGLDDMGVRLNADGTVDQVLCDSGGGFSVDYRVGDSDWSGPVEWEGADAWTHPATAASSEGQVIRYGRLPFGASSHSTALPPPPGWTVVELSRASFARDELVEGEWVWTTSDWPWIPAMPCGDVELDAAGDPIG